MKKELKSSERTETEYIKGGRKMLKMVGAGKSSEAVKRHSVGVAACTTTEETQQIASNINVSTKEKPEKCLATTIKTKTTGMLETYGTLHGYLAIF